jgi:hypothetical protein
MSEYVCVPGNCFKNLKTMMNNELWFSNDGLSYVILAEDKGVTPLQYNETNYTHNFKYVIKNIFECEYFKTKST